MGFELSEVCCKFFEFWVICTESDVISYGQHIEGIAVMCPVKLTHVVKERILICQMKVIFNFGIHLK